jgi:hypothetical protein
LRSVTATCLTVCEDDIRDRAAETPKTIKHPADPRSVAGLLGSVVRPTLSGIAWPEKTGVATATRGIGPTIRNWPVNCSYRAEVGRIDEKLDCGGLVQDYASARDVADSRAISLPTVLTRICGRLGTATRRRGTNADGTIQSNVHAFDSSVNAVKGQEFDPSHSNSSSQIRSITARTSAVGPL